jgi:hypothetical protein
LFFCRSQGRFRGPTPSWGSDEAALRPSERKEIHVEEREKAQDEERGVVQDEDVEGHAVRDTDDVEGHKLEDAAVRDDNVRDE